MNKYSAGDKLYCYTLDFSKQLVASFMVAGVIKKDDGIYYSHDLQNWVKEEYVHADRKEAYKALIQKADGEMNSPEHLG